MEKIKFIDKKLWKYFWLCSKDSWGEWNLHFEGWTKITESVGVAITTAILTLISQRIFNGVLKMGDINIAIISVIGAPFVWMGLVYLGKLIFAPYRLYTQQQKELKKLNLDGFCFSIIKYALPRQRGFGVRVENNNEFDVDEALIEVKGVLVDDISALHTDRRKPYYLLKSIKNMDGLVEKKIVVSRYAKDNPIGEGDYRDFVLTINNNGFSYEIEAHPFNLNIFDCSYLEDYRNRTFPILFQLEFRASTTIDGEKVVFPFKTLYVQENEDGAFEEARTEFWE